VVRDWVDVPSGRLEQYQWHIDPKPPACGAAVVTVPLARTRDHTSELITNVH